MSNINEALAAEVQRLKRALDIISQARAQDDTIVSLAAIARKALRPHIPERNESP